MQLPNPPTAIPDRIQQLPQTREASAVMPIAEQHTYPEFEEASRIIKQLWELGKYQYNDAYKIGSSYHGIEFDAQYIDLITVILNLLFTNIKEQVAKSIVNIEERQKKMIHINTIQKAIQLNLDMLKNFDFTVDKNILLAALSGYINTLTGITVESFKK